MLTINNVNNIVRIATDSMAKLEGFFEPVFEVETQPECVGKLTSVRLPFTFAICASDSFSLVSADAEIL